MRSAWGSRVEIGLGSLLVYGAGAGIYSLRSRPGPIPVVLASNRDYRCLYITKRIVYCDSVTIQVPSLGSSLMPDISYLHSSLTPVSFLHARFALDNVVAAKLYNDRPDSTL
ncbi:hypothetical protein BJV78DRAFT_1200502 [Lactifluus subvellereus]|nr:hypothetical protein BJV78DRAFT_1200502 [Lactifluus subvellereus]